MHDADRYETISIQNGKKVAMKEKYISYVYAITNHQNTCIFFSKIIRFFRHTSWSHEPGITSKELRFFIQNNHLISFIFCIKLF